MPQGIFQGFSEGFTGAGGLSTAVARSRQADTQSRQVGVQEKQVGLREKELKQKAASDKVKNKLDAVKVFSAGMSNPDQADELIIQNAKGLYAAMGLKLPNNVTVEQLKPSVATAKKIDNILKKGSPTKSDTRTLKALSIQLQNDIGSTSEAAKESFDEANRIEDKRREDDTLQLAGLIQRNATTGGQASPEDAQTMLLIKNRNPDQFPAMMEEAKQQAQGGQEPLSVRSPAIRIAQERAKGTTEGDKFAEDILEGKRATVEEFTEKRSATAIVKELPKLKKEAFTANNGIKRLNKMQELINTGNVTGKGGQIRAGLAGWAELFGVAPDKLKEFSDAQLFQRLGRMIVGPLRLEIIGPGQVTEFEQKILQQMGGGGGLAADAAKELLTQYAEIANEKVNLFNTTVDDASRLSPNLRLTFRKIEPVSSLQGQDAPVADAASEAANILGE